MKKEFKKCEYKQKRKLLLPRYTIISPHIPFYHRMTKIRIANSVVRSYLEALSSNAASLNLPV